jgi:AmmeMemoRadiSam system protein A
MAHISFDETQAQLLLQTACASIDYAFEQGEPLPVNLSDYPATLQADGACFVTLMIDDRLRGCKGSISAFRPLITDVSYHAYSSAFTDSRFPPLQRLELPGLHLHISVLSQPEPIYPDSEMDLINQLRPGIDGLIIKEGWCQATFLPSVWESLPEPQDFLRYLKQKAGMPLNHWSKTIEVQRYTTESISASRTEIKDIPL